MNARTAKTTESAERKVVDLLTKRSGTRGQVLYTEPELFKVLQAAECVTKTDMMMALHNLGHPANSIAKTLQEYGVLSSKSSYQHVRNTIERKASKKAS